MGSRRILMANGMDREIRGECHPDPRCEALRRMIVDAEIEQAIGRARLVTRTADNPCYVYVYGQIGSRTP
jgi:hypothetical protein